MALTEEERKARQAILREANITDRYMNLPLSKKGASGKQLRTFMHNELKASSRERYGVTFVSSVNGLAQSFTRDIVLSKVGARFYYLNNFVSSLGREEGLPDTYVLEWFEQEDTECPYSPRERYNIETRIAGLMDTGVVVHLFTGVAPSKSVWWSKAFMRRISEVNKTILGGTDDDRKRGGTTIKRDTEKQGQKSITASKRVTVRQS